MNSGIALRTILTVVMVGGCVLSTSLMSEAQTLIHACVNTSNGSLRIVAQGTACGNREMLLTWPAEPGAVASSPRHNILYVRAH
jgi:hypothetical protein